MLSYNDFIKETKEVKGGKVTEKAYSYYVTLCEQRRLEPKQVAEFKDSKDLSDTIEKLMEFYPASPKQIETITTKVEELKIKLSKAKFTEEIEEELKNATSLMGRLTYSMYKQTIDLDKMLPSLTGGKDGRASIVISTLMEIEKNFNIECYPSDKQIETIVSWFLCPDVDYAGYNIITKVTIDKEKGLWRKPTVEELMESINVNMTNHSASEFIQKHIPLVELWKKNRINLNQIKKIRDIEKRLMNDRVAQEIEIITTIDGVKEEKEREEKYVKGTSYTPIDEISIYMLDHETAEQLIKQLYVELNYSRRHDIDTSTINDDTLRNSTYQQTLEKEYKNLENLMFYLEKIAGYQNERLHEIITMDFIENYTDERHKETYDTIRNFMQELLHNGYITLEGIYELMSQSQIAKKILIGM